MKKCIWMVCFGVGLSSFSLAAEEKSKAIQPAKPSLTVRYDVEPALHAPLETATATWLQAEGDEPTKKYFMWIEAGKHPKIPDGKKDDTHFVEAGAAKVASLAVAQIREQKLPLVQWLK